MTDLAAALAAIHKDHRYLSLRGLGECLCGAKVGPEAAHESHVAELQVAYLREHLTDHAAELGMAETSGQLRDSGQP